VFEKLVSFGLAVAVSVTPAVGQQLPEPWMPLEVPAAVTVAASDGAAPPTWLPPLASLLLPGSGQLLQGHTRGAAYLALEGFLLLRFVTFYREGQREGDQYRELAFSVARAPFEPSVRDTVFEYYEKMGKFVDSGPYDADPGSAFVPPDDPDSYNGSIWNLAKETYFPDPDDPPEPGSVQYQRALAFYEARAVGPNFLWSWRNAGLEQDLFRRSIQQSDEGFRRATQQLGLVLANHLISAIDAFITGRLAEAGAPVAVRSGLGRDAGTNGPAWSTAIEIGF
jgi:hypothetical protein